MFFGRQLEEPVGEEVWLVPAFSNADSADGVHRQLLHIVSSMLYPLPSSADPEGSVGRTTRSCRSEHGVHVGKSS